MIIFLFISRIELAGVNQNVQISEVDCTKESFICQANNIRGYPTLIFYHDGKQVNYLNCIKFNQSNLLLINLYTLFKIDKYTGDRKLDSFTSYMIKMIEKVVTDDLQDIDAQLAKISNTEDNRDLLKSDKAVFKLDNMNAPNVFKKKQLLFLVKNVNFILVYKDYKLNS